MSSEAQIIKRVRLRPSRTRDTSPPVSDTVDGPPSTIPDTLVTKLKNKQKRSKPQFRLSFGTDDQSSDTEIFKIKKSNFSQKTLGSDTSSTRSSALLDHDQVSFALPSSGPTYTQAYLNELKARMPSSPVVRPPIPQIILDASSDVAPEVTAKHGHISSTATDNDFVSLTVVTREDGYLGPHPDSRLVREEDEFGEGEDDMAEYTGAEERIALGPKARRDEEIKRRMGMIEMIEDAEAQDEEISEWELAQIRRAGPVDGKKERSLQPREARYKPAPVPFVTSLPTLTSSMTCLTDSLKALTSSHASHLATLSSLADERTVLEFKELEMRRMIEKTECKRGWFVAFREWIEGVACFLDEKYPSLEALDNDYVSLLSERNDIISKRRRLDDEDDITLLGNSLSRVMLEHEDQDILARPEPSQPTTRITRHFARTHRRLRRARNRDSFIQQEEGYSTDGSLVSTDADDFRTAMSKLEERRKDILSDVQADDFRDPRLGLAKWFGEWREMYAESYEEAWGGLGLVAAWEFWSRLEMVGWNPIEGDPRDLGSFEWAVALHEYSRPRGEYGLHNVDVTDIGTAENMASSMIFQVVIPRLCKIIEGGALDPYSTPHIRRTIDIAEQVEASIEQEGVRYQMFLRCVSAVFGDAVTSTKSLLQPLSSDDRELFFDPKVVHVYRRFLLRRLKLLVNLLKWRKHTGERFGLGELATSLIQSCILPVAARGWEIGGEEILRKAVENVSTELVPAEVAERLQ